MIAGLSIEALSLKGRVEPGPHREPKFATLSMQTEVKSSGYVASSDFYHQDILLLDRVLQRDQHNVSFSSAYDLKGLGEGNYSAITLTGGRDPAFHCLRCAI